MPLYITLPHIHDTGVLKQKVLLRWDEGDSLGGIVVSVEAIESMIKEECSKRGESCIKVDGILFAKDIENKRAVYDPDLIKSTCERYGLDCKKFIQTVVLDAKYIDELIEKVGEKDKVDKLTMVALAKRFSTLETGIDKDESFQKFVKDVTESIDVLVSIYEEIEKQQEPVDTIAAVAEVILRSDDDLINSKYEPCIFLKRQAERIYELAKKYGGLDKLITEHRDEFMKEYKIAKTAALLCASSVAVRAYMVGTAAKMLVSGISIAPPTGGAGGVPPWAMYI